MSQDKKVIIYIYIFLTSTVSGVSGVYALYKQLIVLGWILVFVWAVLAVFVRTLIIKDKKLKFKKINRG
ncbi:MAG: hypothetical protein LBS81_01345 [Endomicrobium sp.]|jgi:hypothetical protein|nr:hypothetical protein [Endomicrobium sp.]